VFCDIWDKSSSDKMCSYDDEDWNLGFETHVCSLSSGWIVLSP
jgi:hypothetical protein